MLARSPASEALAAAHARADRVDALIQRLLASFAAESQGVAIVALGAYGRRELTPRGEVDVLMLYSGELSVQRAAEALWYPLVGENIRLEHSVRTVDQCIAGARRSWSVAMSFLDARFVGGERPLFEEFALQVSTPLRRDTHRLRARLRAENVQRHAHHAAATSSTTPDVIAGRGGLRDASCLRWLGTPDEELAETLDFLLRLLSTADELTGHTPHRLTRALQQRIAAVLGYADGPAGLLQDVYAHARRISFQLETALMPVRADRIVGHGLAVRGGRLTAEGLSDLALYPSGGLRVANSVGLDPPASTLLAWASQPGPPLAWDEASLTQMLLLLRAADWRAWDFLDVTGLLTRYVPELGQVWRRVDVAAVPDQALDAHTFASLRQLHAWTDTDDPFAKRLWSAVPAPDLAYLAVLFHELDAGAALAAARRLGLDDSRAATIAFAAGTHRLVIDTAMRRDLDDPDVVFDLASRVGSAERLSLVYLVAVAHELASGSLPWQGWIAEQTRQLHARIAGALRRPHEFDRHRARSLERRRQRIILELRNRHMDALSSVVPGLPARYVLSRSPAFVARHLALLQAGPLGQGEVRLQAHRRKRDLWDLQVVAQDRPGLLAAVAGALTLQGLTILAADAATSSDGLVLDVFTVGAAHAASLAQDRWPRVLADVRSALAGRLPLADLLGARPAASSWDTEAIHVSVDNVASQAFSVVEVRAPDEVGLLYRIAQGMYTLGLDIHHAKIATLPQGALDVFYVRDASGDKLSDSAAKQVSARLTTHLRGVAAQDG